jgi:hypothetical protein
VILARYHQAVILKKSLVGLKNFTKKAPNFLTRSKLLIPTLQIKIFAVLIPSWYLNWPKYEFVFGAIGEFSNDLKTQS